MLCYDSGSCWSVTLILVSPSVDQLYPSRLPVALDVHNRKGKPIWYWNDYSYLELPIDEYLCVCASVVALW